MQFLMSTTMLPMLAKPVYGIISDSVYIKGAHRIPYLMIAGLPSSYTKVASRKFVICAASIVFQLQVFWRI